MLLGNYSVLNQVNRMIFVNCNRNNKWSSDGGQERDCQVESEYTTKIEISVRIKGLRTTVCK